MFQISECRNINHEKACGWGPGLSTNLDFVHAPRVHDPKVILDGIFTVPVGVFVCFCLVFFSFEGGSEAFWDLRLGSTHGK